MRKLMCIMLFSLVMNSNLAAQSYRIIYEKTVNNEEQLSKIADPALREKVAAQLNASQVFELIHNDGKASYNKKINTIEQGNLELSEKQSNVKVIRMGGGSNSLYKNLHTMDLIEQTEILGKPFLINDKLHKIAWKKTNKNKTIGDFVCIKAIAELNGKTVVAWFTPSIPIQDGPGEFWGLPGLIMQLSYDNKDYNAISINEIDDAQVIKPTDGKKINRKDFEQLKFQKLEDLKQSAKTY